MTGILRSNKKLISLGLAVCAWLLAVGAGSFALSRHTDAPGPGIHADAMWPVGDQLPRAAGVDTLVMFVHPQCPCSRASVNELEVLMTRCQGKLATTILFAEPQGLPQDSSATNLWQSAARIPGVTCVNDHGGQLTNQFGAVTSGQVFLYDTSGALKFSGGITATRGHAGDNDGINAIEAIANNRVPLTRKTPVFGCVLQ